MGLIGGGLGFGLGGLWIVLGSRLPTDVVFNSCWKAMEFTFGMLLGGSLRFAAFLNRRELIFQEDLPDDKPVSSSGMILKEFVVALIVGLLILWAFSFRLDPYIESGSSPKGFSMIRLRDIAILFSNYAFFGLLMIIGILHSLLQHGR